MINYGTTQAGKEDAIGNVQQEIESVRDIMTQNIERVLERGERIDLLVDKTDRLGAGAHDFRVRSRGLRRRMWCKNVKLMVLLSFVVACYIFLLAAAVACLGGRHRLFPAPNKTFANYQKVGHAVLEANKSQVRYFIPCCFDLFFH